MFESGIINYELSVCEYVLQTLRLYHLWLIPKDDIFRPPSYSFIRQPTHENEYVSCPPS